MIGEVLAWLGYRAGRKELNPEGIPGAPQPLACASGCYRSGSFLLE